MWGNIILMNSVQHAFNAIRRSCFRFSHRCSNGRVNGAGQWHTVRVQVNRHKRTTYYIRRRLLCTWWASVCCFTLQLFQGVHHSSFQSYCIIGALAVPTMAYIYATHRRMANLKRNPSYAWDNKNRAVDDLPPPSPTSIVSLRIRAIEYITTPWGGWRASSLLHKQTCMTHGVF